MWARRGRRLLQSISIMPKGQALPAQPGCAQLGGHNVQQLPASTSLNAARAFNTGFWDVPQSARQELYLEMHTIRNMLPNRSPFTPHFTPHGVLLMPSQISSRMQSAALVPAQQAVDEVESDEEEPELWADSVKRKRKLKMKKHKVKKRNKRLRHQLR